MMEQGKGSVVSIISDAARIGEPKEGVYSAAKGGVVSLTKSLAKEYGKQGIRFNAVSPGTTKTEQNAAIREQFGEDRLVKAYPLRRLGEPIDIANAVLFFSSDRASWVTGQTLSVSGGYTMI